jgi:hypothetical protein
MNDRKLQDEFEHLNNRFFHGKIILNYVGYSKKMPKDANGYYDSCRKTIFLDSRLQDFPNLSCMILIHETAHAYLDIQDYKGYPNDAGHGMMFQAELTRLIREGAYDGIL